MRKPTEDKIRATLLVSIAMRVSLFLIEAFRIFMRFTSTWSRLDNLGQAEETRANIQSCLFSCIDVNFEVHLVVFQGEVNDSTTFCEARRFRNRQNRATPQRLNNFIRSHAFISSDK